MSEAPARHVVIKKVAFAADDHEMGVILATIRRLSQESSRRRGAVRRGLSQDFLRQLLVAGYIHLYGAFPRPMGAVPEHAQERAAPDAVHDNSHVSRGDSDRQEKATDIPTTVAQSAIIPHDDAGQHKATKIERAGLDFSALTGGGINVGNQTT